MEAKEKDAAWRALRKASEAGFRRSTPGWYGMASEARPRASSVASRPTERKALLNEGGCLARGAWATESSSKSSVESAARRLVRSCCICLFFCFFQFGRSGDVLLHERVVIEHEAYPGICCGVGYLGFCERVVFPVRELLPLRDAHAE